MSGLSVDRGPSPIGTVIAVLAAAVAVGLVADAPTQRTALAIEVGGLIGFAVGVAVAQRGLGIVSAVFKLMGVLAVVAAISLGVVLGGGITVRVEFLPGAIGLAVLGRGLMKTDTAGSRRYVAIGVGSIFVGTIASGVMHGAGRLALLGSIVAVILAWDAGERAISLGEQVGRRADTTMVELVHATATVTVGGLGILAARIVYDLDVTGLPLAGLVALLAAALVLATGLYARESGDGSRSLG